MSNPTVSILFWSAANQNTQIISVPATTDQGNLQVTAGAVLDKLTEAGIDSNNFGLMVYENKFQISATAAGRNAVLPINFDADGNAMPSSSPVSGVSDTYSLAILASPRKTSAGGSVEVFKTAWDNLLESAAGSNITPANVRYVQSIIDGLPTTTSEGLNAFREAMMSYTAETPQADDDISRLRSLLG